METESVVTKIEKAPGKKCERCRTVRESVGISDKWPGLCQRCVVSEEIAIKDKYTFMVYMNGDLMHYKAFDNEEDKQKFLTFIYNEYTKPELDAEKKRKAEFKAKQQQEKEEKKNQREFDYDKAKEAKKRDRKPSQTFCHKRQQVC